MALPAIAGLLVAAPSSACWDKAAARYGLSSHLLYALARTESGLNPAAVDRNCDGSRDIGLMQINSSWLPTLAGHRIAEHHLLDACTSIHVGAWIPAGNVSRLGYTWDAPSAPTTRAAHRGAVRTPTGSTASWWRPPPRAPAVPRRTIP
jgi:soluble lytic murein transglycosylase-like protein